jgi:SAM-dependent methyltransferase
MPSEKQLMSYYPDNYYAYLPQAKRAWWKRLILHILPIKTDTRNPEFSKTGNFLDIGCGNGAYLHVMAKRGWKVCGVEPSSAGASEANTAGFDVFHGTLLEAHYPSSSFDYVRCNHSLEHMPNPVEVLQDIHRILRPGGKLCIGIPNTDSFTFRLFGRYWWYLCAPVHTYNYSAKTITRLLQNADYEIEKVHYNSDFWGLLGSMQIFMNRNTGEKADDGWMARSRLLRIIASLAEKCIDFANIGDVIEVICERHEGSTGEQ